MAAPFGWMKAGDRVTIRPPIGGERIGRLLPGEKM